MLRANAHWTAAAALALLVTPHALAGQGRDGPTDVQEPRTITLGETIAGELDPGDGTRAGKYFMVYRYHHDHGEEELLVSLTSPEMDPYLEVRTETGELLAWNDDDLTGPFTLNSRLRHSFGRGVYHLVVTTFGRGETGRFNLTLESPTRPVAAEVATRTGVDESRRDLWARIEERAGRLRPHVPKCERVSVPRRAPASERDFSHPWHFTNITELTSGGSRHRVHRALEGGSETPHRATAEVDRESKVRIEFARDWLTRNSDFHRGAAIRIRGQVVGDQGVRNVEIPGYSIIGERSRQATALIGSIGAMREVVCPPAEVWYRHGPTLRAAREIAPSDADYIEIGREIILESAPTLETTLRELVNPQNEGALRFIAEESGEDPDLLVALGRSVVGLLEGIQADSGSPTRTELDRFVEHWSQLAELSARMGRATDLPEDLPARLFAQLKDTEISISETGASNGDRLILYIENDAEGDSLPRRLQINLVVRDFGFTRRINDAILLVNRAGVSPTRNRMLVSALSAGSGSVPRDTTVSLPYNFAPTPGVTLGWNWYPRDLGPEWRTELAQWLNPGIGINVSFPRFGEKTVRLLPAADDESTPSFDVEEDTDDIGFAAGMVVSLFGNALQATLGWNLTAERDRFYWGLGFSFARIVGSVSGDDVLQGEASGGSSR